MATATRKGKTTARRGITKKRIRVAIIGVGNCASSLVQGVHYYRNAKPGQKIPGLMHVELGGYHLRDVEFVAAFDVDRNKVGKDLADAIYASPNNTYRFADVVPAEVHVHQARDELVVRRVLVVLATLQQRVRAVADADQRNANLAVAAAPLAVRRTVLTSHPGETSYRRLAMARL